MRGVARYTKVYGVLTEVVMEAEATEIVIEDIDEINTIGSGAFNQSVRCSKLTLADSVVSIEENAFYNNPYLKTLVLGSNLELIAPHAFAYRNPLTKIEIASPFANVHFEVRDDGCLYTRDGSNTLVLGVNASSLKLNGQCKRIGICAFSCCKDILSIELPNSLETIEDYGFADCSGLVSLIVPTSVSTIGDCAFFGLSNCLSIRIGENITNLPALSFGYCPRLNRLLLPNLSEKKIFSEFGEYAFQGCSNIGICFRDADYWAAKDVEGLIPPARHYVNPGNAFEVSLVYYTDEGDNEDVGSILVTPGFPYGYLPTPEYEDHSFDGWYDQNGNKVEPSTIFTGDSDTTLYGRFTKKTLMNVCFYDKNGNPLDGWPQKFRYGDMLVVDESLPSTEGYIFAGWHDPENPLIGTVTFGSTIEVKSNLNFSPVYVTSNIFRYSSAPVDGMYILYGFKSTVTREDIAAAMTNGWLTLPGVYVNGVAQPTKIQNSAFKGQTGEERLLPDHIILGEGIVEVGDSAFRACALKGVEFLNSTEVIGNLAFYQNFNLTTIGMNETGSLNSIGDRAFEGCTSLETMTWDKGDDSIYAPGFRLPSSVKRIGDRAFYNCSGLTNSKDADEHILDDSFYAIEHIGDYAFTGCDFRRVHIKDSYIGYRAFRDNKNLASVNVEGGFIGDEAFKVAYKDTSAEGTTTVCNLKDVSLGWDVYHLGKNAFYYSALNVDLTRFKGLRVFQDWIIGYTTSLGNVEDVLDLSLTRLRGACVDAIYSTSREFTNINRIILPDNEFSACSGAFSSCSNIGHLEFFEKSRFEENCFYYRPPTGSSNEARYTIAEVNIPREVVWTGSEFTGALSDNYVLKVAGNIVPSFLYTKDVSPYACYGCSTIVTIMLGSSVTTIGESAFENCTSLKNVFWRNEGAGTRDVTRAVEDNLTIEENSFKHCVSLESLDLSAWIFNASANIAASAFEDTSSFNVYMRSLEDVDSSNIYYLLPEDVNIYVGGKDISVVMLDGDMEGETYASKPYIKKVVIGPHVTSLSGGLFTRCTNLTGIVFENTAAVTIKNTVFRECTSLHQIYVNVAQALPAGDFMKDIIEVYTPSKSIWEATAFARDYSPRQYRLYINGSLVENMRTMNLSVRDDLDVQKYKGIRGIKNLIIGSEVTYVADNWMAGATELEQVRWTSAESNRITIGISAFEGCENLTTVELPTKNITILQRAFYGCSNLTSGGIFAGNSSALQIEFLSSSAFDGTQALDETNNHIRFKGWLTGVKAIELTGFPSNNIYKGTCFDIADKEAELSIDFFTISSRISGLRNEAFNFAPFLYLAYNRKYAMLSISGMRHIVFAFFNGYRIARGESVILEISGDDGMRMSLGDYIPEGNENPLVKTEVVFPNMDFAASIIYNAQGNITKYSHKIYIGNLSSRSEVTALSLTTSIIRAYTFEGCSRITSVVFSNDVSRIEKRAFADCNNAIFDTTQIPNVKLLDGWAIDVSQNRGTLNLSNVRGLADDVFENVDEVAEGTLEVKVSHSVKNLENAIHGHTKVVYNYID